MVTVIAVTMTTTIVHDTSEAVELYASQCLYMKPIARLTMTVMLPEFKEPTRSISNWEVMEKLKDMVYPDLFLNLKVSKSTADFIRFEGEVETKGLLRTVIAKLHGRTVDINGGLRVLAAEAQYEYPTPQDWESFFKSREGRYDDLANILPDTLHIEGIPCKWFASRDSNGEKPCEEIVKNVFGIFGTVRNIDVPMLDPYREDTAGKNFFSLGGLQTFDAYIQYVENSDFIKAMETLRGMKLLYKGDDGKALACSIKVTFDTTDHLSEEAIKKRHLERLKLQELEQQRKEEKRREKEEEEAAERRRKENEEKARKKKRLRRKEQRQKERQEKRCLRKLQELQTAEESWLQGSDEWETRKFLLAQRRVASIRLLTVLLNKVKDLVGVKHQRQDEDEHSQDFETKQDVPGNEIEKPDTEERDKLNVEVDGDKPDDSNLADKSEGEIEADKEAKQESCQDVEAKDLKEQTAAVKETVVTPEVQNTTSTECLEVKEETQSTSGPTCEVPEKEKTPTLLLPLCKTLTAKQIMEQSYDDLFSAKTKTKQYLDCGALQVTINQNCKKPKLTEREKSCSLDVGPLRTVTDMNHRKKQKIYETDEFIHYLLNHYESPRYARILESQSDLGDNFIWHREVSENGDGFKVHLKNSGQQLTEVHAFHDLEEEQYEDQYSWKITITETEPKQKLSKVCSKKQPGPLCEELQVQLSNSTAVSNSKKHKLLSKTATKEVVSTSDVKKMKLSDRPLSNSGKSNNTVSRIAKPVYKAKGAVHELKDVLEEISSESEYFSEESRRDHKLKKIGKGSTSCATQPKPTKHDLGSLVKVVKAKKKLASAKRFSRGSSVPLSKLALKSRTEKKGSKKVIKKKAKVKSKKLKNGKRHEEQETDLECIQKMKALNKKKKKKHLIQKKVLLEETELSESESSVFESQKVQLKKKSNKPKQSKSLEEVKCSSEESVCEEYAFENTNRYGNHQRKMKYSKDEMTDRHSFHNKMFNQSYEYSDENYYYRQHMQDYNVRKEMPNKTRGFDTRHLQSRHLIKKDVPAKKRMKVEK